MKHKKEIYENMKRRDFGESMFALIRIGTNDNRMLWKVSNKMGNDRIKSITDSVLEMHKSLRVEVKIPHDEVDRLIVTRLISIRNSEVNRNTDTSFIDKTIKWFLTEEEFQKYAIDKHEIEY